MLFNCVINFLLFVFTGLVTTTSRRLDREQQDEHILEVGASPRHLLNMKKSEDTLVFVLSNSWEKNKKISSALYQQCRQRRLETAPVRERKTGRALAFRTTSGSEPPVAVESSTCKKEEKKPFEEFSPCSDFRMGSEGGGLVGSRGGRHVGDSSDCSLCSFPLFRLMDGASWDRKPSSTPTGRCLNLWLLIKADYVHFQQFFFSKHTFLTRQNKELFFFFFS